MSTTTTSNKAPVAAVAVDEDDRVAPRAPTVHVQGASGCVLQDGVQYLSGWGAFLQSEALPGALPVGMSNPQVCPYGAVAELISGTSFTTPRVHNQRTWMYRIHPMAGHAPFQPVDMNAAEPLASKLVVSDFSRAHARPSQFRWQPFPLAAATRRVDFVQGLATVCGAGSPDLKSGLAIHVYTCNTSMTDKAMCNSDGDLLIVPQQGTLTVRTEMGVLVVPRGHICVIPRGIVFSVALDSAALAAGIAARGYVLEVFSGHFRLPDLGPIGSNGLANPRDFLHPVASYENRACTFTVVQKYIGEFFSYTLEHSPFNTIAWHGNYLPYMYDLNKFIPAGAVRADHLDPSIFTVLTCPTNEPGVAMADFVIFPPRWAVQEDTFRPPWYHRNCMAEFMGNIYGRYEAKPDGFLPGGASLHSIFVGHGPDAATFDKASHADLAPHRMTDDSMSFMFETTAMMRVTDWALNTCPPDPNYYKCWEGLATSFDEKNVDAGKKK